MNRAIYFLNKFNESRSIWVSKVSALTTIDMCHFQASMRHMCQSDTIESRAPEY